MHDFNVTLKDGRYFRVERKNASPTPSRTALPR